MDENQTPDKEHSPYLRGVVVGAMAGALAGGLLTVLVLWGLMGSGHGGPLEGTCLAPVAWALVLPGLLLGEVLGLGTMGWIVGNVLPYGIIGALIGARVTTRRSAKSDRHRTGAPAEPW